jgi:hypothetical protein
MEAKAKDGAPKAKMRARIVAKDEKAFGACP